MEEGNNNPQPQADFSPQRTQVSFPGEKKEKKSKKGIFIIILLLVGVLFGGGFFLFRNRGTDEEVSTELTPTLSETSITSTSTPEPLDRSDVSIEIMNGSGVSGEAAKLKSTLADLGYTDIEVGNASKSDYVTTEVTFKSSLNEEIKEEILDELEGVYSSIEVNDGSIGDKDVEIIIGYKKGFTPTPKATATPTKAPTATVSATVTPTKTPTPSPTP